MPLLDRPKTDGETRRNVQCGNSQYGSAGNTSEPGPCEAFVDDYIFTNGYEHTESPSFAPRREKGARPGMTTYCEVP